MLRSRNVHLLLTEQDAKHLPPEVAKLLQALIAAATAEIEQHSFRITTLSPTRENLPIIFAMHQGTIDGIHTFAERFIDDTVKRYLPNNK